MTRPGGRAARGLAAALLVTIACTGSPGDTGLERSSPSRDAAGRPASRGCDDLGRHVRLVRRGRYPGLAPDVLVIPSEPNYVGPRSTPVHSGPWDYLTRVPLVLYGPGVIRRTGEIRAPATMADLAPTTAALVGFEDVPGGDGRVLGDALTGRRPRVVVTVVWDGGGSNVLREHGSRWPFLRSLMRAGVSYTSMSVGSSPSVTPPVHATLGTGTFPSRHGIVALNQRNDAGELEDPLLFLDPSAIRVPTLADAYDRSLSNRPVAGMLASSNWHLGMIGHGAQIDGADRDPVVLVDADGAVFSNPDIYSAPVTDDLPLLDRLTTALDRRDGEADGRWGRTPLDELLAAKGNPARVAYEQVLLERFVAAGGFGDDDVADLLYVNFKAADEAGHMWGMTSPQVGAVLESQDRALRRLVAFLDSAIGRRRWALMVTADHGQTPLPEESGGWAIAGGELERDLGEHFGDPALIDKVVSAGVYVDRERMTRAGLSLERIARWTGRYTAGENRTTAAMPARWEGRESEPLFDAVLAGRRVVGGRCVTD